MPLSFLFRSDWPLFRQGGARVKLYKIQFPLSFNKWWVGAACSREKKSFYNHSKGNGPYDMGSTEYGKKAFKIYRLAEMMQCVCGHRNRLLRHRGTYLLRWPSCRFQLSQHS